MIANSFDDSPVFGLLTSYCGILDAEDVSFALGCCYSNGDIDIRQAMSIADKRMYKNKKLYYEKFPDRKRTAE